MNDPLSELLIAKTPLSAPALAERLCCPIGQLLSRLGELWWEITPVAGPDGWTYTPRQVLAKSLVKPRERREEWGDVVSRSKYTTK